MVAWGSFVALEAVVVFVTSDKVEEFVVGVFGPSLTVGEVGEVTAPGSSLSLVLFFRNRDPMCKLGIARGLTGVNGGERWV